MNPRLQTALRIAGGAAVLAVCGGALAVVVLAPWPGVQRDPVQVTARPEPDTTVVACAGPLVAAGQGDASAATFVDAAGSEVVVAAAAPAVSDAAAIAAPDVIGGAGAASFSAAPVDRIRAELAASGSSRVQSAELSGFAASACVPPQLESWLVGGSAATGAADVLVLANPGDVASSVDVTIYGGTGAQQPAAGVDIVVPAGSQRVVPIASLGLGEQLPVLRVTAGEAPVSAWLQTSIIRTLDPGGVDQVDAAAVPAQSQTIPAVSVVRAPGEAGATDITTILRMLAPSAPGAATVTVTRVGASAPARTDAVTLEAGVPLELELGGLDVGTYTVRVDADVPVTAAVWETSGFAAGDDFAWYPAASRLNVPSLVAVADGPGGTLTIAAGARDAVVEVAAGAGAAASETVTVAAGTAASIAVDAGETYRLVGDTDDFSAALTYQGDGALASVPVLPGDAAAEPIVVVP